MRVWEWSHTPAPFQSIPAPCHSISAPFQTIPAPCHSTSALGLILPLDSGMIPPQGTAVQRDPTDVGLGESSQRLAGEIGLPRFFGLVLPPPAYRADRGSRAGSWGLFISLFLPSYGRKPSVHGLRHTLPFRSPGWYPVIPKQIHPSRAAHRHSPRGRILPPRPR